MLYQGIDRFLLAAHRFIETLPGGNLFFENRPNTALIRDRELKARRQAFEFARQRNLVTDENQGALGFVIILRDIFQEPHIYRILQIGMKIQQHIHAVLWGRLGMTQHRVRVFGFRNTIGAATSSQPVTDIPGKQGQAAQIANAFQQLQHPRFFMALDQNDREARHHHEIEVVLVVHDWRLKLSKIEFLCFKKVAPASCRQR